MSQLSSPRFVTASLKLSSHLTSLMILVSALVVSGCENSNLSQVADDIAKTGANQQDFGPCVQNDDPFRHTLCSVAQDQITPGSNQALKLFWKPRDTVNTVSLSSQAATPNSDDQAPAATNQAATPLYRFDNLLAALPSNTTLKFAANAGMYNAKFAPIGYTVIQGEQIRALNLKEGGGNFHLLPNGVLWWDKSGQVQITESHELQKLLDTGEATPWYATQSGPMLVINNKIHPKFDPDSISMKFRNGVGVCDDGKIKFVNSDDLVNFYHFAALFKDQLNCPNALFLDGGVASALYAPNIGQQDDKNMGVMIGLVESAP